MGPGQLSQQCCDFFVSPVGLIELPHPEEVGAGISSQAGMRSGDVDRQLLDHAFAPGRRFNLAADVLADAPVKLDQRRVDGGDGACPCGVDQPKDFIEVGWRR